MPKLSASVPEAAAVHHARAADLGRQAAEGQHGLAPPLVRRRRQRCAKVPDALEVAEVVPVASRCHTAGPGGQKKTAENMQAP